MASRKKVAAPAGETKPTDINRPPELTLMPEERPYVVKLVRLLRENYWAAELVRQILDMEGRSRGLLTIKQITDLLGEFEILESLASNAKKTGFRWSNHPILVAIRKEWGEIEAYKDERNIRRLIESAHQKTT